MSGVSQGATRLSLGFEWARAGDDHTLRLAGEAEHLLRDHWGLVGAIALPVAAEWVAPATIGVRFHLLPKTPLDPFLGVAGGVAWVHPSGLPATVTPLAGARAGIALHYWGTFFAQADGGWDLARYGAFGAARDRGGPVLTGRLGVYF